jgi:hypothetical protein
MKIEPGNSESLRSHRLVNRLYCLYETLWVSRPLNRLYIMVFLLIPVPVLTLSVTYFYREPLIEQTTEETKSSLLLWNEIESVKAAGPEKEMKIAMANWEDVREKIPGSYEAVSDWILDLNRFISLRGFKMSYNLGELKPAYKGAADLSLISLNLKLTVPVIDANQTKSVSIGTIQFVELLHEIVESYYGVDLVGLEITGIGDGIKTMNVSINLWVGFGSETYINKEV